MSRKRERENPCFICNHYHNYEAGEPCSVCGHGGPEPTVQRGPPPSAFPTLVVPDLLYLGSYDHAARAELLKAMGVKRILNVRLPACCGRARTRLWVALTGDARAPGGPARCSHARAVAQTVPDCQNLYKNSFLYHSASATPAAPKLVPLDECVAFIGACTAPAEPPAAKLSAGTRKTAARPRRRATGHASQIALR